MKTWWQDVQTTVNLCEDGDDEPNDAYTRVAFAGRLMLLNTRASLLAGGWTENDEGNAMERETRARRDHCWVMMSAGERARIEERARAAGLSVSAYLRASGLSHPITSVLDYDAVRELAKLNGDQGRLGALLKLWLEGRPGCGAPEIEVHRLLERIDALQRQLIDVVARV